MFENKQQGKEKKKHLTLTRVSDGIQVGVKSNGTKYTVRDDRSAYFFPERWQKFMERRRRNI
jgi:hypothetical protein